MSEAPWVLDPEGAHIDALRRLADFDGQRVLELGCGDGRLMTGIARDADDVLATDPDADAIERAVRTLPQELMGRVRYRVAKGNEIDVPRQSFDLVVFSWSL